MIELDVHTHLAPIRPTDLAKLSDVAWDPEKKSLAVDGHKIGVADLFYPDRLLARMERLGIKRSLVSVPPPLYRQGLSSPDALTWARYLNAGLLEICKSHPERLGALFYVPMEHPSLLTQLQADHAAGHFEGFALAAGGHPDIVYSDPEFDTLWSWLNEQSAFVFVHPGTCADQRLGQFYLENLVGNPVETGVAASHLVMAGVPARYPNIRFCLAHAGGIFTSLVGRLERGFETERAGVDLNVERPFAAARRFYADGIAHNEDTVLLARKVFGDNHVLYGSDWPFPMGQAED